MKSRCLLNFCNSTSQFISIMFRCSLFFYFIIIFFYQIKNFLFLLQVNLYMITGLYLHDPPPFNGPFFMTPPFSKSQKVVTLPLFPPPSPPANFCQVPLGSTHGTPSESDVAPVSPQSRTYAVRFGT